MPTRAFTTIVAVIALLIAGALPLSGCGGETPDQKEVRANWKRYFVTLQNGAGIDYHDLITEGSVEFYTRMLPIAIKGTRADIDKLTPAEKREVLVMRHRVPLAKLKSMDARAYIIHSTSEKFWADPELDMNDKGPWDIGTIIVTGDTAVGEYPIRIEVDEDSGSLSSRRKRKGRVHVEKAQFHFVKESGAWRVDEVANMPEMTRDYQSEASMMGVSIEEYLITVESERSGKTVRSDVFDKPPR